MNLFYVLPDYSIEAARGTLPAFSIHFADFFSMHRFHSLVLLLAATTLLSMPCLAHAQSSEGDEPGESLGRPVVAPTDSGAYGAINKVPENIRESLPFAREFYEFARHAGSSGVVDNEIYRQTFEEARNEMLREREQNFKGSTPQSILSTQWTNIGFTGGDTIPSAGITRAIVFDPQSPNIMYAGGNGGVWKSVDTGANWFQLTDNQLPNLSVTTIAVDPVSPDTLYIGTGNCESGVPPYDGSGVYRSYDGGTSFQQINPAGGGIDFVKVTVDPSSHNTVLAACYDKSLLFRSTNNGSTWTQVTTVSGLPYDIIATPAPNSVLYVATTGGVFKSTNDGATWTKSMTASNGRCALASPAMAPNKVFELATDGSGSQVHLFMTTDAGADWDSLKVESQMEDLFNGAVHAQGWYDLAITASPNSVTQDTIYCDGVMAYRWTGTDADLINVTTNAFKLEYSDYGHSAGGNGYPHVDHHSFAINPVNSNIVYDGNDGGLWVNYIAGSNDISAGGWMLHTHSMITNRIYHINMVRNNAKLTFAGAQDQGLWEMQQGKDPNTFTNDGMGDALQPLQSVQNSGIVYGEAPDGQLFEGLTSWSYLAPTGGWRDDSAWDVPFAMSPISLTTSQTNIPSSQILYVARQHLWQSTNGGKSWTKLNPNSVFGYTNDGVYLGSAIGLPNWNANLIYAAGGGNAFWASKNFGVSWSAKAFPTSGAVVTSIGTNYQDTNFIVVSLELSSKKVMMSDDGGQTWTDVSGVSGASLPGADANSACNVMTIAVDSLDPLHTWYAGTDFGMYMTTDQGHDWSFMGPGLFPCRDVQIAANKTTMRLGTFGRGVWELDLPFSAVELTSLSVTKQPQGSELSWYVDNEPVGAQFFVQRSVDGDVFQNIGNVAGQGASSSRHEYAFADNATLPGSYLYRVHEVNADGSEEYTNQVELHYGNDGLYFSQPYPNPLVLNGTSSINLNYELPAMDNVAIRIYTIDGTLVRTLLDHSEDGGPHALAWDARDVTGNLVAPGSYLCTIQTGISGTLTQKIMIVRQ